MNTHTHTHTHTNTHTHTHIHITVGHTSGHSYKVKPAPSGDEQSLSTASVSRRHSLSARRSISKGHSRNGSLSARIAAVKDEHAVHTGKKRPVSARGPTPTHTKRKRSSNSSGRRNSTSASVHSLRHLSPSGHSQPTKPKRNTLFIQTSNLKSNVPPAKTLGDRGKSRSNVFNFRYICVHLCSYVHVCVHFMCVCVCVCMCPSVCLSL